MKRRRRRRKTQQHNSYLAIYVVIIRCIDEEFLSFVRYNRERQKKLVGEEMPVTIVFLVDVFHIEEVSNWRATVLRPYNEVDIKNPSPNVYHLYPKISIVLVLDDLNLSPFV